MPAWLGLLKVAAAAAFFGLVALHFVSVLTAVTVAVFALWLLLSVTREG